MPNLLLHNNTHVLTIYLTVLVLLNLPQAHLSILLLEYQSNNLFVVLSDKLIPQKQGTSESLLKFVSHFESCSVFVRSLSLSLSKYLQSPQKNSFLSNQPF